MSREGDVEHLLQLAASSPQEVPAAAAQVLQTTSDYATRSVAHQSLGIVLRDSGRIDLALGELRIALRDALSSGDDNRVRDVRATYGSTLIFAGRTSAGLRQLDQAATGEHDAVHAKVLVRRGTMLAVISRYGDALIAMREALSAVREIDDRQWEARTLNTLGYVELALGLVQVAEAHVSSAEGIFIQHGNIVEARHARQNLGAIAFYRGDLTLAMRLIDEAIGDQQPRPSLAFDRTRNQLAAGLTAEAVSDLVDRLSGSDLSPTDSADLELALAEASLAAGDAETALESARRARDAFRRQGRGWFELRGRLYVVRANARLGRLSGLAAEAREVAEALDEERADEAPLALTMAALMSTGAQREVLLARAGAYRGRPGPLVRAAAWLAVGLARPERGSALRACERGLAAVDEHREGLGSAELRALATTHSRDIAEVALINAAHDPRTLLRWTERTRATGLTQARVSPKREPPSADLVALRANGHHLAEARANGDPTDRLTQERSRLERAVRAEHHRRSATTSSHTPHLDVAHLVTEVGTDTLVEIVDVDSVLHVLVVRDGRVRRRVVGPVGEALELADFTGFALRRAARGRPLDVGDLGPRLQAALLGDAVRLLGDGGVTIVPTGALHGVPWGLIPALASRPFTVVPSARQWLRARAALPMSDRLVLMTGPSLSSGGAEVPALAARHPEAVVLEGADATVEAALTALDGARLAHVAAHGSFRADSPLFSSLELADGPLTVYELERLSAAPHRMILSACESGVLAPVGTDELLGLASALFGLGTAGLVCSVAEVNDEATAVLMLDLHERLATHDDGLGPALLAAREAAVGDPVREATAAAFLALGV